MNSGIYAVRVQLGVYGLWVLFMDIVDKQIIFALNAYCRATYQELAQGLKLTVNAVKKRINKLMEQGIIRYFYIYPSLAMTGGEMLLVLLYLDEPQEGPGLLEKVGADPRIFAGSYLADNRILLYAEYNGAQELDEIGQFLRSMDGVTLQDMHTLIYEKGARCELTKEDLLVIKTLRNNARMPVAKIAAHTGLSPRRIRKILEKLVGEGESSPEFFTQTVAAGDPRTTRQCIHFRVRWDLNAGGSTTFMVCINWDVETGTRKELVEWLSKEFSSEYWYALTSASKPALFAVFVVDKIRDAEPIVHRLKKAPSVISTDTLFGYPTILWQGPRDALLEKLFADAGLSN
jgi:DNA-binding Lrp family transcriptional regulator